MADTKFQRAAARAERLRERMERAQAELRDAERESDRALGEAVRLAVTSTRSRWAQHAHVSVRDFYALVTSGGESDSSDASARDSGDAYDECGWSTDQSHE